jgi:hypothetical protein
MYPSALVAMWAMTFRRFVMSTALRCGKFLVVFAEEIVKNAHLGCALNKVVAQRGFQPPEVVIPSKITGLFGIPADLVLPAKRLTC